MDIRRVSRHLRMSRNVKRDCSIGHVTLQLTLTPELLPNLIFTQNLAPTASLIHMFKCLIYAIVSHAHEPSVDKTNSVAVKVDTQVEVEETS